MKKKVQDKKMNYILHISQFYLAILKFKIN